MEIATERDTFAGGTLSPPVEITATHDTHVDAAVYSDLEEAWEGTIRPFLVARLTPLLDSDDKTIMEDSPDFDYKEGRITGRLRMRGYSGVGDPLITAYRIRVKKGGKPSHRILPVATGDKRSAHILFGPEQFVLTLTEEITVLGLGFEDLFDIKLPDIMGKEISLGFAGVRKSIAAIQAISGDGTWVPIQLFEPEISPYQVGGAGGSEAIDFADITQTGRWQLVKSVLAVELTTDDG